MHSARKQGFIIRKARRFDETHTTQQKRHMSQTQFYRKSTPLSIRSPGHIVHIHDKQDNDNDLAYSNYFHSKDKNAEFESNPENYGAQTKFNFQQTGNDLHQKGEQGEQNLNDNSFEQVEVAGGIQAKVNLKIQQNIKLAKILQKLHYQLQHRSYSTQILQCVRIYIEHLQKVELSSVNNLPISIIRKKVIKQSLIYERLSVVFTGLVQVLEQYQTYKSFIMNLVTYSLDNLLLRLAILTEGKDKQVVELLKQQKKQKHLNKSYDAIKNNNQVISQSINKVASIQKPFYDTYKKLIKANKSLDVKNQFLAIRQFIAYYLCESARNGTAPFLSICPAPYLPPQQFQKYTLVIDVFQCLLSKNRKAIQNFRPFAEYFLDQMSQYYEIVSFCDALPVDANRVISLLDRKKHIKYRLFKHHLNKTKSQHGKDLTRLGRDLDKVILIDTTRDPQNHSTIVVNSWKGRKNDAQLAELCPILAMIALKKLNPQKAIKKLQEKSEQNSKIGLKYLNCGINLQ